MLTEFGKSLRRLRIDQGELLKDMADRMSVSSAYLSAVENGKKPLSEDFFNKLLSVYNLDASQVETLTDAFNITRQEIRLDISNSDKERREMGLVFARRFGELNPDEVSKIKKLLEKR